MDNKKIKFMIYLLVLITSYSVVAGISYWLGGKIYWLEVLWFGGTIAAMGLVFLMTCRSPSGGFIISAALALMVGIASIIPFVPYFFLGGIFIQEFCSD